MGLFGGIYNGKRVLVTGHTGFKGSWLTLWLKVLGANVVGYSLAPATAPNHYQLIEADVDIDSVIADVRDYEKLGQVIRTHKPEIIFHLAAQSLVRYSYDNPVLTYATNVMGTVNLFEHCRGYEGVKAIVNITSDKCYENKESTLGYRENDRLGGYDPYASSKACAELVTTSYRNSFFNPEEYGKSHNTMLSSARAGNVIGGGDWALDRLIPDIMRAVDRDEVVFIRVPGATRPWQHLLEPLSGYLLLGQRLLEGKKDFADGWNFGPDDKSNITVLEVVEKLKEQWSRVEFEVRTNRDDPHETGFLALDSSKARAMLEWTPVWGFDTAISATARWYRGFYEDAIVSSADDIESYIRDAKEAKAPWTL